MANHSVDNFVSRPKSGPYSEPEKLAKGETAAEAAPIPHQRPQGETARECAPINSGKD